MVDELNMSLIMYAEIWPSVESKYACTIWNIVFNTCSIPKIIIGTWQGLEQAKFNVDGKPLWYYKEV